MNTGARNTARTISTFEPLIYRKSHDFAHEKKPWSCVDSRYEDVMKTKMAR